MSVLDTDGRLADMRVRAERFAARVEGIRGKGTRLNGRLVFEVDARKNPVNVAVDASIGQYNADSIAELFHGAARDACQDVDRQMREALVEFGEDQKTRELVRELMGPLSPRLPPAPGAQQRQAEPQGPDPDDEEAWNDARSWLEKA
ncbi:hypothetical protein Srot_0312 [Segniliparus rotundus DSM 44985]|uniref:YbaB/EbfC DNA-binding family protein n=1 Tax=Segniliparus rotundus (strain ATCC BAA-972 / CDC 1076 / CIP 108378 / DSM 44985 / JCM 13578) TaxID=640132 RepID=D6ZB40_SEGRD|nr:hypothetical protein [Segniliparus rotundus]ADG96799.1 hypothetical protein Srot_0312 [Segniliparus rotundus DSM 44985]